MDETERMLASSINRSDSRLSLDYDATDRRPWFISCFDKNGVLMNARRATLEDAAREMLRMLGEGAGR